MSCSVDQCIADQRGVGSVDRDPRHLSARERPCIRRQVPRPHGNSVGRLPDRAACPLIRCAAECTEPGVARVCVGGVHQVTALRMVGARMHRERGDRETCHTSAGEPWRAHPARVASDDLELRREQKRDERRYHAQCDRSGAGHPEHDHRDTVDEADENEQRHDG